MLATGYSRGPSVTLTATLTIDKAPQEIIFTEIPDKTISQNAFQLEASGGGSGLPVTFLLRQNLAQV
ncbi:hypothetical protein AAG747_12780 [Rapidithrix thailandica]|uniref:Uncharacterized protein n=1 Tax=Rapidithrix thailandica TaxID=413964 RepID=A0AAW9S8Q4_9BACT